MPSRRAAIIQSVVNALAPSEAVMDTKVAGFGVRNQGGGPVFFVRAKTAGRPRLYRTIGRDGEHGWTAHSARAEAQRLLVQYHDPEARSPLARQMRSQARLTVRALADQWLTQHVERHLKPSTIKLYRVVVRAHIIPRLGEIGATSLTRSDIQRRLLDPLTDTPGAAGQAVRVLKSLYSWARRMDEIPSECDPLRDFKAPKAEERQRRLEVQDAVKLGQALQAVAVRNRHSPFALAAIAFLLLTGLRKREALDLRWSEVDADAIWLADTKGRKKSHRRRRRVPINPQAVALLARLPRTSSSCVFPNDNGQPFSDIRKAWAAVLAEAGLDGFDGSGERLVVHSLRHSFASVAVDRGANLSAVKNALGHSNQSTTERYVHASGAGGGEAASLVGIALGEALELEKLSIASSKRTEEA